MSVVRITHCNSIYSFRGLFSLDGFNCKPLIEWVILHMNLLSFIIPISMAEVKVFYFLSHLSQLSFSLQHMDISLFSMLALSVIVPRVENIAHLRLYPAHCIIIKNEILHLNSNIAIWQAVNIMFPIRRSFIFKFQIY